MAKLKTLRCPTCRTVVLAGSEDFPFCSDRCRLIDLGRWLDGKYQIPVVEADESNSEQESDGNGDE